MLKLQVLLAFMLLIRLMLNITDLSVQKIICLMESRFEKIIEFLLLAILLLGMLVFLLLTILAFISLF